MARKPRKPVPPTDGVHVYRGREGVCTVRIVECPTHVHVVVGGRRDPGRVTRREDRAFDRWMLPLLEPYEDDGRPIWIDHADGGERAFIHKLRDGRVLVGTATTSR